MRSRNSECVLAQDYHPQRASMSENVHLQGYSAIELGESFVNSLEALATVQQNSEFARKAALPDPQINHLQANLVIASTRLKYIENASRSKINRLPASTLAKIFSSLSPDTTHPPFPPHSLRWIAATHVCVRWREVALSTPSLWSHILLHAKEGPTMITAFITRSNDVPLTLIFGRNPGDKQSIAQIQRYRRGLRKIISSAEHRVQRVIVEPGFPIDDVLRADLLGQELYMGIANMLEPSFRASPSGSEPSPRSAHPEEPLSTFFFDGMAEVQHLELYSAAIPYFLRKPQPFQRLTVLQLLHIEGEFPLMRASAEGDTFGLCRLLNILSASKSTLRKLTLVGIPFRDDLNPASHNRPPIALQSLESIEIGEWPSTVDLSNFLHQLQIPPTALRCIWGSGLRDLPSNSFSTFLLPTPAIPGHSDWSSSPSRIVLSSVPGGDMVTYHKETLYINLAIPFHTYSTLFLTSFSLELVREIVLTPLLIPLTPEDWTLFFVLLPNVHTITIRDAESTLLFHSLLLLRSSSPNNNPLTLPLPRLSSIDIQYRSGSSRINPLEIEYTTELHTLVLVLTFLARERAHAGSKLDHIDLTLDTRVLEVNDWVDLEMAFRDLEQWAPLSYTKGYSQGFMLSEQSRSTRFKEEKDRWHLVMRVFDGIWPTKAAASACC